MESIRNSSKRSAAFGGTLPYAEQLNQSSAYQRAQKAAAEELLAGRLELLEENFTLRIFDTTSLRRSGRYWALWLTFPKGAA